MDPAEFHNGYLTEWDRPVVVYRCVGKYAEDVLINNHTSLRVPNTEDQFRINPYGLLYEQITASSLVKIDVDGNVLDDSPYQVNRASFVIHSAIHMARKDLHAIIHTHTVAGQAISALDCGLLPLNQSAMRYYKRIGYHEFEGVANDLDERERIVADLGDHKCLIMKHHGLLTGGVNIGEAFNLANHQNITGVSTSAYAMSTTQGTTPATTVNNLTFSSSSFGVPSSVNSNYAYSPRLIQLALRLQF